MSQASNSAGTSFLNALQMAMNSTGINLLYGTFTKNAVMKGVDSNGKEFIYGYPQMEISLQAIEGAPVDIAFSKSGKRIKMCCVFDVKTPLKDAIPLVMTDIKISMHIGTGEAGKYTVKSLTVYSAPVQHQRATGEVDLSLEEFYNVKQQFEKNNIYFTWSSDVKWIDISKEETQAKIKTEGFNKFVSTTHFISEKLEVNASADIEKCLKGVASLLKWQYKEFEKNYNIYYKDTMVDNVYNFLPQVFRIKASEITNAPQMKLSLKVGDAPTNNATNKLLIEFNMAPYIHPNAKRDLYNQIRRTDGIKYCSLDYGGYESAEFEWSDKMKVGYFSSLGIKPLVEEKNIEAAPGSIFSISFEATLEAYELLRKDLKEGGIEVGNVYFNVKNGFNNKIEKLGPIKVELDLKKLVDPNLEIEILEISEEKAKKGKGLFGKIKSLFDKEKIDLPYQALITNRGDYPLEISNAALSIIAEDKNKKLLDVAHDLKINSVLPVILKKGESSLVELTPDQIKILRKKNTAFFDLIDTRNYWTRLECEPYKVQLLPEYIQAIISDIETVYLFKTWTLSISIAQTVWVLFPEIIQVEVNVKNEYGVDEIITFTDSASKDVVMARDIRAVLATKQNSQQEYTYRYRVVTKTAGSDWTPWSAPCTSSLFINDINIKNLISTL